MSMLKTRRILIQMGKTMAQSISAFWSGLGNFKKQVGNFAADLKAHLHQGQVFANIADVSVIITTDVEKQGYWQAIEALHNEYDSWHIQGDALPPAASCRRLARWPWSSATTRGLSPIRST